MKVVKTIFDFLFFVFLKNLPAYPYALSIFSISLLLAVVTLVKYLIGISIPVSMENESFRGFFQLSVFLFIPVFALLYKKKFKHKLLTDSNSKFNSIPQWVYGCFFAFVIFVDFVLFGYLIMV